jgi:hypothetical protein
MKYSSGKTVKNHRAGVALAVETRQQGVKGEREKNRFALHKNVTLRLALPSPNLRHPRHPQL